MSSANFQKPESSLFPLTLATSPGDYVLDGTEVFSPQYLERYALRIADQQQREIRLGQITAAPKVIVWGVLGGESVQLDNEQKRYLQEISYGKTLAAMARQRATSESTERRKIIQVFDLLGVETAPTAVTAGMYLRFLGPGRTQPYTRSWLDNDELQVCRLVGLGFNNPRIAKRMATTQQAIAGRLNKIFLKIGALNRAHAMRRLFEIGMFQLKIHQPKH